MYYSGFLLLGAWFFWLLRKPIASCGISWPEAMLLFFVGVLATSHHVHQQPEELAVLLTVGLTAFSLSDNRALNCLSGLFLPLMLSCKVVTIWPAVFPLAMVLATRTAPAFSASGRVGRASLRPRPSFTSWSFRKRSPKLAWRRYIKAARGSIGEE